MTDDEAIARGRRAEYEWREVEAAFEAVREAFTKDMLATPPGQVDTILQLHRAVQVLDAVKVGLMGVIAGGLMAEQAAEAVSQTVN